MALPPGHYSFQFNVSSDGEYLDLLWNQRSLDLTCGAGYNIASYALLLEIVAKITNKKARYLICSVGSCHIYENHFENAEIQLTRTPKELPTLKIASHIKALKDVENSNIYDYSIENYSPDEPLKFDMVV